MDGQEPVQEPVLVPYEKSAAQKPPQKKWDLKGMFGLRGAEKKIVIGCLVIIVVALLLVTAGGLVSGGSGKSVRVVIETDGEWDATMVSGEDGPESRTGTGDRSFVYSRPSTEDSVAVTVYSTRPMTVKIVSMDGEVLDEETGYYYYGSYYASATWTPVK